MERTPTIIRAARLDERDLVAAVHERSAVAAYAQIFSGRPFPREQASERWRQFAGRIIIAEDEGMLVGFAAFDAAELHALYVLPGHQGAGIGARLLEAAGSVSLLWVLRDNHRARRFYEARGWRADGAERIESGAVEMRYRRALC